MRTLFRNSAALLLVAASVAFAAELHPPAQVTAGTAVSIPTTGSGDGTFYLIGPSNAIKKQVRLGQDIAVDPTDVETAGKYIASICGSDGCSSATFYVVAGSPDQVSFMLHPSRVPVSRPSGINGTVFVFDKFHNLVLTPATVDFEVVQKNGPPLKHSVKTIHGVAWMRMGSTPKEGPVKVIATVGSAAEPRVIQQVASDACHLRIKATRTAKGVLVETDPVRDCSGNAVPDGTVVSFTSVGSQGKTTVDAPVKKGIARAELPVSGAARISVASGVVIGNEVTVGGRS
jgi:hypothetical protein